MARPVDFFRVAGIAKSFLLESGVARGEPDGEEARGIGEGDFGQRTQPGVIGPAPAHVSMLKCASQAICPAIDTQDILEEQMIGNLVSMVVFWAVYALLAWCVVNLV